MSRTEPSSLKFGKTLVIAPHPDDEVLGAGGTIARLSVEKEEVHVVVATRGFPPAFSEDMVQQVRHEAAASHACLGVSQTHWLNLPAARLTETPTTDINAALLDIVRQTDPETLLIPFLGDIHLDHQRIFMSALVSARPHQARFPRRVLAYETLSETNWNAPYITPAFIPNFFVDISGVLDLKIEAFGMFKSQQREAPHERSIEGLRNLARYRGSTVHRSAAEAFVLIRELK
jgi:N-acetylglucosamine malate deacetylase 1